MYAMTAAHPTLPIPSYARIRNPANGREVMEELNARFGHRLIWVPWKRPGFELAMQMRNAVESAPGCDGIVLAGHGLFTWGDTSRACYESSLAMIDHLGQVVLSRVEQKGRALFGGSRAEAAADRRSSAIVTARVPMPRPMNSSASM